MSGDMIQCDRPSVSDGRPDCSGATSDAVMPELGPRPSGSAVAASREMPAGLDSMASVALPGQEIAHAATHTLVMPGLGPGIHELLGAGRAKAPGYQDKCGSSPRSPQGEPVDARAKPRHDEGGRHRLGVEPESRGARPRRPQEEELGARV